MRHNVKKIKLSRTKAHRRALFRNLLSSLFLKGALITTDAKAKELKRRADRLVRLAKKGTLHARRLAAAELFGPQPLKALFEEWAPKFVDRETGFTRLVKVGRRYGDGAPLTLVELYLPEEAEAGEATQEAKGT